VLSNVTAGTLTVDGLCFAKGEMVVVVPVIDAVNNNGGGGQQQQQQKRASSRGAISSVNNSEVHLRLGDGTKHRVYISHLRNGRAFIKHA